MSDEEITYEQVKEMVEKVKAADPMVCNNCETHYHSVLVAGVGAMCECAAEHFKENGEDEYPVMWRRHQNMLEMMQNDPAFK